MNRILYPYHKIVFILFKELLLISTFLILISCQAKLKKDLKNHTNKNENITIFTASHFIDVQCNGLFVPLRNRILSKKEIYLSQQNNEEAKKLNDLV